MPQPISARSARAQLRLALPDDAPRLLAYRLQNRAHLAPWEPLRAPEYYTEAHCLLSITDGLKQAQQDRAYPLLAFTPDGSEVIAVINFSNVVRGVFQACHLGYSIGQAWQGQGLMQELLRPALGWALHELDFNRVMANYMPRNERSGRLLERLGFQREGYAKRYLRIAGAWEDHVLTSLLREAG